KEEVVVIQQATCFFPLTVLLEDPFQVREVSPAPRKTLSQYFLQRLAGIHTPRVDGEERALLGKTRAGLVQVEIGANQVQQVFGVSLIHHDEVRIQSKRLAVHAQQPMRDGVESAAPDAGRRRLPDDLASTANHLPGSATRKGQQKDAPWARA